ncbi:LytR/AlgR family response regulator transcription factor [Marinicella meishanensis]|uniref:LytR/AlgR family response regulator transcription factor n=1 Tax=Marinicella meishanensis TaxID=2873263 RepID=UPI001CC020F3|nr:LytTR family DNA-binding domain-containing protein [Marinicella sp. NBU2979]
MIENKIKAIVVEDEVLSRRRIVRLLKNNHRICILGEFEYAEQIINESALQQADLLILDINLPGINGIEFAEVIRKNQAVVFTTAYSRYAVDAFDVNAIDYLVKPISQLRLNQAICKAAEWLKYINLKSIKPEFTYLNIKNGGNVYKVEFSEILCVRSDNNHVTIMTTAREYILKNSLINLAKKLNQTEFVRCHRTCIVNINKIKKIIPSGSTKCAILEGGLNIPISRNFFKEYKNKLVNYLR